MPWTRPCLAPCIACALFLLVLPLRGAEPSWTSLRLPGEPAARDVGQYLRTLRLIVNRAPDRVVYRPPGWQPPRIEPAVRTQAGSAFDAVLPNFLGLVLQECKTAESEWTQERIEVYIERPEGEKELAGFDEARSHHRTAFTRLALHHIQKLDELSATQRAALFENVGAFPELILGIIGRKWLPEIDRVLSPKLMRQIDRGAGWRGTTSFWIEALVKVDTDRSREALEYLLVEGRMPTRLAVYSALKESPQLRIDLDAAMAKTWKIYLRESYVRERAPFAMIAATHGVTAALVELAEYVREHWPKVPLGHSGAALQEVLAPTFADARQAADFVVKNRRALVFDPLKRRYDVR